MMTIRLSPTPSTDGSLTARLAAVVLAASAGLAAAAGPAAPTAASVPAGAGRPPASAASAPAVETHDLSLPAQGLFVGNQLSAAARERLTELIIDALGLEIEVALVVPSGPWKIDGSQQDERSLTPARLEAVRRFLAERGVDPRKIYVESRIEEKASEPRLVVQIVGRPSND